LNDDVSGDIILVQKFKALIGYRTVGATIFDLKPKFVNNGHPTLTSFVLI
jgi:hypothetical protein